MTHSDGLKKEYKDHETQRPPTIYGLVGVVLILPTAVFENSK